MHSSKTYTNIKIIFSLFIRILARVITKLVQTPHVPYVSARENMPASQTIELALLLIHDTGQIFPRNSYVVVGIISFF